MGCCPIQESLNKANLIFRFTRLDVLFIFTTVTHIETSPDSQGDIQSQTHRRRSPPFPSPAAGSELCCHLVAVGTQDFTAGQGIFVGWGDVSFGTRPLLRFPYFFPNAHRPKAAKTQFFRNLRSPCPTLRMFLLVLGHSKATSNSAFRPFRVLGLQTGT